MRKTSEIVQGYHDVCPVGEQRDVGTCTECMQVGELNDRGVCDFCEDPYGMSALAMLLELEEGILRGQE